MNRAVKQCRQRSIKFSTAWEVSYTWSDKTNRFRRQPFWNCNYDDDDQKQAERVFREHTIIYTGGL